MSGPKNGRCQDPTLPKGFWEALARQPSSFVNGANELASDACRLAESSDPNDRWRAMNGALIAAAIRNAVNGACQEETRLLFELSYIMEQMADGEYPPMLPSRKKAAKSSVTHKRLYVRLGVLTRLRQEIDDCQEVPAASRVALDVDNALKAHSLTLERQLPKYAATKRAKTGRAIDGETLAHPMTMRIARYATELSSVPEGSPQANDAGILLFRFQILDNQSERCSYYDALVAETANHVVRIAKPQIAPQKPKLPPS